MSNVRFPLMIIRDRPWFSVTRRALADYLRPLHLSPTDPKAIAIIAGQIARQAEIAAMLDVFKLITWSFLGMLPLVLVLRKSRPATDPMASVPPQ